VTYTWRGLELPYQGGCDLGFSQLSLALLTVVVRHGDNGQDKVDEIERAEENDADEEEDVQYPIRV